MAQSIPTLITTNFHLNLIQLWWQLLISNVCLWRRSLRSMVSIDPEKLYRATFICHFGPCCCVIWPLFLFDCFVKNWATWKKFWAIGLPPTLGTRGFSRVRWEFSVLAEGRQIFGSRPKPRVAKPREIPLARSVPFYRCRRPWSFFIGLHLHQSDWKSPAVIIWASTWRNVQRSTLSFEKQVP